MLGVRWVLALALCVVGNAAYGWGSAGHRASGYVANSLLHADTRAALLALVGTDDLAQIATWMDDERDSLELRFPHAARWHYENRSVCGTAIDCRQGACVTAQIVRHIELLKNPRASASQKGDAVRILTHLIGDLHQPLHLTDNRDRGGNDLLTMLPKEREPKKLHEVWDTTVVRAAVGRRNLALYSRDLAQRFAARRAEWEQGNVGAWARETFEIGKRSAYHVLPGFACGTRNTGRVALTEDYLANARTVAEEQIVKAGVRIAWVLNDALSSR